MLDYLEAIMGIREIPEAVLISSLDTSKAAGDSCILDTIITPVRYVLLV